MLTSRRLEESDRELLEESLKKDEFHKTTTPDFFYEYGTTSLVYSFDKPVLVLRGCKALRLDIQFLDNEDKHRNATALIGGFKQLVEQAKANGFKELVFCSTSPLLVEFCKKNFGYEEVNGELRLKI